MTAGGDGESCRQKPMCPGDRIFHEPGSNGYIVLIIGCGKPIDVAVFKACLETTFVRHPRFCSVPVLDDSGSAKSRWVPTKVVVENHIVIPDIDPSGTAAASPDELVEDYVASLTSVPMDPSRPLWELHVLNLPTSDAAATAVLRLHHSLGDCVSIISLILACSRKASDPDSLPTLPYRPRQPPPSSKSKLGALLLWFWALLVLAWNTLVDVLLSAATSIFLKDTPTPLQGSEGVEHRPKRIVHRTVSLDDIKDVKNAMHCVSHAFPALCPSLTSDDSTVTSN